MNIVKATREYEEWLARQTKLVRPDILLKHRRMREAAFPFFRATFYRWMQLWPEVCPDLSKAPQLLAVGDLHIENFGTWRDIEGRLIWGVNDFDEAAELPYTIDLVRLATSALLAGEEVRLSLSAKNACAAILEGYSQCLTQGGRPFVLAEQNIWLREIATAASRDPVHFWSKMDSLPTVRGGIPSGARHALERLMPEPGLEYRVARRVAGLGSLGHIRLVAIAGFRGGRIAREVKALVPSAVCWVTDEKGRSDIHYRNIQYEEILCRAVRSQDPFVRLRGRWIARRLAPYCSRIELDVLPTNRDEQQLLFAMGWETANIHLGSRESIDSVKKHFHKLAPDWLLSNAKAMAKAIGHDWRVWRKENTR
jgi:hypothetical protein